MDFASGGFAVYKELFLVLVGDPPAKGPVRFLLLGKHLLYGNVLLHFHLGLAADALSQNVAEVLRFRLKGVRPSLLVRQHGVCVCGYANLRIIIPLFQPYGTADAAEHGIPVHGQYLDRRILIPDRVLKSQLLFGKKPYIYPSMLIGRFQTPDILYIQCVQFGLYNQTPQFHHFIFCH